MDMMIDDTYTVLLLASSCVTVGVQIQICADDGNQVEVSVIVSGVLHE